MQKHNILADQLNVVKTDYPSWVQGTAIATSVQVLLYETSPSSLI